MKALRILAVVVLAAFILLLFVGFDNVLAELRSRVTIFLVLIPLVGLFLWSVYKLIPRRKDSSDDVIDVTPRK